MQTVNVIEYRDDSIISVQAFDETPEGNAEAEAMFRATIKAADADVTELELDALIEDGFHEQGNYQLFLVHSL